MTVAYVVLKNGYSTRLPCEFMSEDEEKGFLELWSAKGRVGLFPINQVEMCVITEKKEDGNNDWRVENKL